MSDLRIVINNTSNDGGTALTPFWLDFHDGGFDLFDQGVATSAGLESLAEDGDGSALGGELLLADADAQVAVIAGAAGPILAGQSTSKALTVNGLSNGALSLAAMILPSNDAFIGTDEAVQLFDVTGDFLGEQTLVFAGSDVQDAGTELNTELDAAFLNQTAANTGVDQNGIVANHAGFNGSLDNPVGEGDQNILGGVNAAGQSIDATAADFTQPGAQIAVVHVNTAVTHTGTNAAESFIGGVADDIVDAGAGADTVIGGLGWDVINGGAGADILRGNDGNDEISGDFGRDMIFGGDGDDMLNGGDGQDDIFGGQGDDMIEGGAGDDMFLFIGGDGRDIIRDFELRGDDDTVVVDVEGFDSFADVQAVALQHASGVNLNFGVTDGGIFLVGLQLGDLDAGDFAFV